MIIFTKHIIPPLTPAQLKVISDSTTLNFDNRIKSRTKIILDSGQEAGLMLPRGLLIRGGQYLATEDETILIKVIAKDETVSTAYCDDLLQLARICYHLGNRHVPLQIGPNFARYQHDHVLDNMLHQLGIQVHVEQASFEPEAGAYHNTHGHYHDHDNN